MAEKLLLSLGRESGKLPHRTLSNRKLQVLCMFALGKINLEVASKLSLSVKTVSTYRARILERMGIKTNAELTRYAIKMDWWSSCNPAFAVSVFAAALPGWGSSAGV